MTGRHRITGPAPEPYVPTRLDVREHTMATDLTARYAAWFVVWGPYWRCWSAFALFSTKPLVVHAGTVATLVARMRDAELTMWVPRG